MPVTEVAQPQPQFQTESLPVPGLPVMHEIPVPSDRNDMDSPVMKQPKRVGNPPKRYEPEISLWT